jgi:hypothetical protein
MAVEYVENRLFGQSGGDETAVSIEDALTAIIGEQDKAMLLAPYFTLHDIRRGADGLDDLGLIGVIALECAVSLSRNPA